MTDPLKDVNWAKMLHAAKERLYKGPTYQPRILLMPLWPKERFMALGDRELRQMLAQAGCGADTILHFPDGTTRTVAE